MRVTIVLWKTKTAKGYPIRIKTSDRNKYTYTNTGVFVEKELWNEKTKEVRKGHKDHKNLNDIIQRKYSEVSQSFRVEPYGILNSTKEYELHLLKSGKFGYYKRIRVMFNSLQGFIKENYSKDDLIWSAFDSNFILKYVEYLKSHNTIQASTLKGYIKRLKMLFLRAKSEHRHNHSADMFSVIKIRENEVKHKAIDKVELDKLLAYQCRKKADEIALDVWKLCFYTSMRVGDALTLKWSNIDNRSLRYRQGKVGKDAYIPITDQVEKIIIKCLPKEFKFFFRLQFDEPTDSPKFLNKIAMVDKLKNTYVFPYLGGVTDLQSLEGYKLLQSKVSLVNKSLRGIGKELGINHFSSHSARHTITTMMSKSVPLSVISKMLGHSSLKITEKYIKRLSDTEFEKSYSDFIDTIK